jgi:sulfite reductase (NADPH) hemoprotein beta-component
VAGIGFKGSLRKVEEGRAAFRDDRRHRWRGGVIRRVVAKLPARRIDRARAAAQAVAAERQPNESSRAFFRRDPTRIKLLLADLDRMTAESATPDDYIDLAETTQFVPETMEGECAS